MRPVTPTDQTGACQSNAYFPLFLDVGCIRFLIVGAGNVALAKLDTVLEFTDRVTILAPAVSAPMETRLRERPIRCIRDRFAPDHVAAYDVVIAATGDATVNAAVAAAARGRGLLVNVVDKPALSTFIFGATLRAGQITVAISTSGLAPVLSRWLKQNVLRALPPNLEAFNAFLVQNRERVRARLPHLQARRLFWADLFDGVAGAALAAGDVDGAQRETDRLLEGQPNAPRSAVYVIGVGPGDPDLLTLRAIRLLSRADIVLYTEPVAVGILAYARRDAHQIKAVAGCADDWVAPILSHAGPGRIVVLLAPGNPVQVAHRIGQAVQGAGIDFRFVPGLEQRGESPGTGRGTEGMRCRS